MFFFLPSNHFVGQNLPESYVEQKKSKLKTVPISGRPGSSEVPRNPLVGQNLPESYVEQKKSKLKTVPISGRPGNSEVPRNPLTRWDMSSIPANGIFLTKKQKNKCPTERLKSLVHKIRLHGRRGKGMAESFSREKLRHAPQKEGGREILCDLPPV